MRFYLSKADEAGHESDRQRVMMQIVQELCKRPGTTNANISYLLYYVLCFKVRVSKRCVTYLELDYLLISILIKIFL
jgi:hypothetical protein